MPRIRAGLGSVVLSVGHVAGMIDMIALPLWIGALIERYHYDPARAGAIVTLFLSSVVVASALVAPRFDRLPHRVLVTSGFAVAAAAFAAASRQPVGVEGLPLMAALHAVAGLGVGCALSITHGAIGRTKNPHRLFGLVNVALGVVGVAAFAGLPPLIAGSGAQVLFVAFAGVMTLAALVCALAFPGSERRAAPAAVRAGGRVPLEAWLVAGVVVCMTFNQAMVFSFVQQIGVARGFGEAPVGGVLVALGFVNLLPGGLAAALQRRLSPLAVGFAGPIVQATLALTLSNSHAFAPYAVAAALYVSTVIFTHTFLFGLLSRLDPTGRSVAATPAMMMIGSCAGPGAGGLIVSFLGYGGLGAVAAVVALVSFTLLTLLRLRLRSPAPTLAPVAE